MADSFRGILVRIGRVLAALVSFALGAVAGFLVTLAIVVARARMGSFVYALGDMVALRWETVPILLGAVAGGWLGVRDPRAAARAALSGVLGVAIGVGVGTGAGALLSDTPEGLWSGLIIGGVVGMVCASVASVAVGPASRARAPERHHGCTGWEEERVGEHDRGRRHETGG